MKSTVKFVNLRPFLVVYSLPLFFVFVVVVTGLLKKRFKQTTIFIFLWSAIAVVFNIPPNNRYNIVIIKYSSICLSTDQYFHETL